MIETLFFERDAGDTENMLRPGSLKRPRIQKAADTKGRRYKMP